MAGQVNRSRVTWLAAATVVAACVVGQAQERPKAEVSAVADADSVHAGSTLRVAVRVTLPDGIHVQSNAPRDPMLIGTSLTVQAPGVTVVDTAYPPATDFRQAGQSIPLAVFEQKFVTGLKLSIASDAPVGDLVLPIRLRYQACSATTCFAPTREEVRLSLRVVAESVRTTPQQRELFESLRFSR